MFEMKITPGYADADPSQHINGVAFPKWFETARNPIFKFFIPDLEPSRWNLILRRIEVDMVAECFYNAEVTIRSYIESVGTTSFIAYQEAWQHGKMVATGRAVIVHFHLKSKEKIAIPAAIRSQLEAHRKQS